MAGHILVIDDVAINRIMLEVRLSQLSYQVSLLGSIAEIQPQEMFDAVIIAARCLGGLPVDAIQHVRNLLGARVPVMVLLDTPESDRAADALAAGADDALWRAANPAELVARLRSLTRRAGFDAAGTAALPAGYAIDSPACFALAPVLVVGATQETAKTALKEIAKGWTGPMRASDWSNAAKACNSGAKPEVVVFAVSDAQPFPAAHLLMELRAHRGSGGAAILGLFDTALERHGIELMNMGADDLFVGPMAPREIGLRISALMRRQLRIKAEQDALRQGFAEALLDPMTGLQNRRGAMPALARESERARRSDQMLALMLVDVDHFKRINDTYGHRAGDEALIEISRRLHAALPDAPVLARIGGEEFLIGLTVEDPSHAIAVAEEIRHAISACPVALGADAPEVALTVSVGIQLFSGGLGGIDTALQAADGALYAAKNDGRNRVCVAPLSAS